MAKDTEKTKYQVATFWHRAAARILDVLFVSLISFAFSFLFFLGSSFTIHDFFQPWNSHEEIQGWRVFLLMLFLFVIDFVYFVVIPTFWRGQTLFKRALGIRVVSANPKRLFFWQVFKREILLWMVLDLAGMITGIVAMCVPKPLELFSAIFNFSIATTQQTDSQITYGALATFIRTLYAIGGMVPAFIAIYMFSFRKKRALQDVIGDDYVVFTKHHDARNWSRFLFKKQVNQTQEEKKAKIFEPFIDFDRSKYLPRHAAAANLKVHWSVDDHPLPGSEPPPSEESKGSETGSWYDEI